MFSFLFRSKLLSTHLSLLCLSHVQITGQVRVGIKYSSKAHTLTITVAHARNLIPPTNKTSMDPYIKTYLLPHRTREWKRKTTVKQQTLNPTYNETLEYKELAKAELMQCTLQVMSFSLALNLFLSLCNSV